MSSLSSLPCLLSLALLLSCSEGTNATPPTASRLDAASERGSAPGPATDVSDATPVAADRTTGTVDGRPEALDQGASADKGKPADQGTVDKGTVDKGAIDKGAIDKGAVGKDAGPPPANDTCAAALPLAFVGGVAAATGDTRSALDDVNVGTPGCVKSSSNPGLSFSTPGKDLFYVVQLTGGQTYTIRLDGASASPQLLSGALYVLASCTNPKSSCKVGGLVESSVWPEVVLTFTPATTASYWIGVDGLGGTGGAFALTVQ